MAPMDRDAYDPHEDSRRSYDDAIAAMRMKLLEAGQDTPLHPGELAELQARFRRDCR